MQSGLRCLPLLAFALILCSHSAHATVGATTLFTTYEAEAGTLVGGASVVSLTAPPTTEFTSPQLEASGHAYVALTNTGQSVTWTNNTGQSITALNIRFSIPDSSTGGGISSTIDLYVNGTLRQAVPVNSIQSWLYETSSNYDGMSQTPSSGNPHKFWDETHFFITGTPIAPGSTITLQKDTANSASFYNIDCIDLEVPPAALTQPTNSLSITSYGAVANNSSVDSTKAIQNCINAAQTAGESVWIPQGTFYLNTASGLKATGVTITGAGMWYSVIYANVPLPSTTTSNVIQPTSCILQNFAINSDARSGGTGDGNGGAINIKGNNWLINSLWIEHEGAAIWADGTNGTVENCRIDSAWADGININNGNGLTNNNTGDNLTVENNFVRGSGDDAIAINSGAGTGYVQMENSTVINNTTVAPWWANGLGIYGGGNNVVENNLITDSVKLHGMLIGVFGSGSPLDSGVVEGNVLLRTGSFGYGNINAAVHLGTENEPNSIGTLYFGSNTISNSMFDGIHVYKNTNNVVVENNSVAASGTTGLDIDSDAVGDGVFNDNIVADLASGQTSYLNKSASFNVITTSEMLGSATQGSAFDSESGDVSTQTCSEGGLNVDDISTGSYTVYNNVNLNGVTTFVARVASYLPLNTTGGSISVYLDSPTGTLLGTCPVTGTGGWQSWATVTCPLSGATGIHNVYLVYKSPLNLEWFSFLGNTGGTVEASSFDSETGGIAVQSCSEGGLNLGGIASGSYTVYNNMNLNGATAFLVREACWSSGSSLQVYLDSPTGTPIATCALPATGGAQVWTTTSCPLTGITGTHTVYLVNTTSNDHNLEWFSFKGIANSSTLLSGATTPTPPPRTHFGQRRLGPVAGRHDLRDPPSADRHGRRGMPPRQRLAAAGLHLHAASRLGRCRGHRRYRHRQRRDL
jgi:Carbohydrate binding module (family 6)